MYRERPGDFDRWLLLSREWPKSGSSVLSLIVGPALLLMLAGSSGGAGIGGSPSFETFQSEFTSAWQQRSLERLDGYVSAEHGLWIIYSPGLTPLLATFTSLSEPLNEGEYGFAYLGVVGWHCQARPGSEPKCQGEGSREPICTFGPASRRSLKDLSATRDRKELELLLSSLDESLHFLSDESWGAVFYFVLENRSWRLVAVDMRDCSA